MNQGDISASSPILQLRERADAFAATGAALASASPLATPTGTYLSLVAAGCQVVAHLCSAEAASFDADTERVTAHSSAARQRAELITSKLEQSLRIDDPLARPLWDFAGAIAAFPQGASPAPLMSHWKTLPLAVPVVLGARRAGRASAAAATPSAEQDDQPVAVALASLDGQLVQVPPCFATAASTSCRSACRQVNGQSWVTHLDVELLSHLNRREMTTPSFSWSRRDHSGDGETYAQSGSVVLNYRVAAGSPAPPLLLRLTWRGVVHGEPQFQTLDVAGHRELRLRPYDESRDRATDWPVFDERLLAMYDRLARNGYDQDQLQAFCRLFTSICRAGLAITWERKYRRGARVVEREFHDDIHERAPYDPELGGRVERGTRWLSASLTSGTTASPLNSRSSGRPP